MNDGCFFRATNLGLCFNTYNNGRSSRINYYHKYSVWKEPTTSDPFHARTLQSLEGTVLLEFLFMKPSIQCWNFFLTKESSSQLHSEYGRPIHLQRYSGSLEDVFLWLWAVYRAGKTGILTDIVTMTITQILIKNLQGKSDDPDAFPVLVA